MDVAECARGMEEYVGALEEERRKILVFQRELPLCLHLVTQAIESVKQQMGIDKAAGMASERPVLEEFLPMRPSCSEDEEERGRRHRQEGERVEKKPDWLRSVQLWNQDPEPLPILEAPGRPLAVDAKKTGGAFQPFDREKRAAPQAPAAAATTTSSSAETTTVTRNKRGFEDKDKEKEKEKEEEEQSQPQRKARRTWSTELHRRFLDALQLLGGSHAATPKQIRELMKVDGLTNDEVKSHLQKYRLHTRRPSLAIQNSSSSSPQVPQFVVVGGIWVPPPEYAAAAAAAVAVAPTEGTSAPLNGIYAPVASVPSNLRLKDKKQTQSSPTGPLPSIGRSSREGEDGVTNSASPTASSSSQTTTASLSF